MRPNVDLAFAMLRSGACGHLTDPSPEQVERARDVIAETYSLPGSVAMERIGQALGLKPCVKKCCKPAAKRKRPDEEVAPSHNAGEGNGCPTKESGS